MGLRFWDCRDTEDEAEHVLYVYPKWISKRTELENLVGQGLNTGNLVENILRKDGKLERFQEILWSSEVK